MFIFEVAIYLFFAYVMYLLARKSYTHYCNLKTDKPDCYLWMFWLFFALVAGIRWNVGADSLGYARIFAEGKVYPDKMEPLWDALVLGVHNLGMHYSIGLAITAFVQIYFMTKQSSRYRYVILFLPFVIFGSEVFFVSYCNGVRQMMAACIFVFASQYIVNKKIYLYAIWVFIAYQIHHSAILVAPMYLLAYIRPDKISFSDKRWLSVGIFLFCVAFGRVPTFQRIAEYFTIVTEYFGDSYEYVGREIERTLVEGDNDQMAFGPAMLSNLLLSLFPIYFGKELKKEFKDKIPYFDLWWLFTFIYSCGFFLFINVNFMVVRPFNYFLPFLGLISALLFYYFYSKRKTLLFALFFISIWTGITWQIIRVMSAPVDVTTYKVFWNHSLY